MFLGVLVLIMGSFSPGGGTWFTLETDAFQHPHMCNVFWRFLEVSGGTLGMLLTISSLRFASFTSGVFLINLRSLFHNEEFNLFLKLFILYIFLCSQMTYTLQYMLHIYTNIVG